MNLQKIQSELAWLKKNPAFDERPASLPEFLGPDYLNIEKGVRASIRDCLTEIMGKKVNGKRMTAYQLAMITGGIGIGKAQPVNTPVLTPKGWVPIGSLSVGDFVIGSNGRATKVEGVFPQGEREIFRVTTTDGATTLADGDHLWQVHNVRRKNRGGGPEVLTTREILARGLRVGNGQRHWQLPLVKPVHYEAQPFLPLPAYAVGALIGDGGMTCGIRFSTLDSEILARVEDELGIKAKHINGCDYRFTTKRGQANPALAIIRQLGMDVRSEHKRIPEQYLMASVEDRKALLAGLMDTDGFQATFNHTSFTSCSRLLTEDVMALVRSLGGIATIPKFKAIAGRGGWTTTIKTTFNPFMVERKASRWMPRTTNPVVRSIDSIEPAGLAESVCIKVEAPDSLYVTEDFLLTHNTTIASIVLPYLCHWCLCLKDPQDFYDLLPGSRIAFMQMSTSEDQAVEVVFGDIFARIKHSTWFREKYPYDPTFKKQIRFEKDIWILPGDSKDTTFEGYNILGGILDEADSHQVTERKDYAQDGFDTIHARITSRFQDRGFLLVIGQMKKSSGFAATTFANFQADDTAYARRMTIWESFGWDKFMTTNEAGEQVRDSFWYDSNRKQIIPTGVARVVDNKHLIEIPTTYRKDFENNPEKALKDLAGIPPAVGDPFISLTYKITEARDRWLAHHPGYTTPVDPNPTTPVVAPWFRALETLKRVAHIDIGVSDKGDAAGLAMGHVREVVEIDGEYKPYIVIDFLMRIKAPAGGEVFISELRRMIYTLRDEWGFKLKKITFDGFQCFTGDTEVPLLDGRVLTMAQLAAAYPEGGVHTYSWDGTQIIPGKVTRAWRTGQKKVISVLLDNGEMVRCTEDHRWMRRDGSYVQARNLVAGDSLMPLYRRTTPDDWKGLRGYEQVWQPRDGARGGRKWQFTHKMAFAEYVPEGHVIHHGDVNKLNNDPTNLRLMSLDDHLQWHREHGQGAFKELWANPEFRAKTSAAVSKSNAERVGRDARRYRHDITVEALAEFRHLTRRDLTIQTGWSQDAIYDRVREAGFDGWADFRKNYAPSNHKVVGVFDFGEVEDVYDLTVEDHHNFALQAGVFVHNSTDTDQQLRKRRFATELVSVDKQVLPYHDLREAIYEDRIEFPQYMTYLNRGDAQQVEIAVKELTELEDHIKKIDHPKSGSKDLADAIAGVTYTLMGDRTYRRNVVSINTARSQRAATGTDSRYSHPALGSYGSQLGAPVPPSMNEVSQHLRR